MIIPLSFLRRLDSLKYTSIVALLALSYLVLTVVAHFLMGDTLDQRGEVHYFKWQGPMRFFSNLPVIIFAFTCHQNVRDSPELTDNRSLPLLMKFEMRRR